MQCNFLGVYPSVVISLRNQVDSRTMNKALVPILVRVRPETKALLLRAAKDQRRSQASIVDWLIRQGLQENYSSTEERLEAMLNKRDV